MRNKPRNTDRRDDKVFDWGDAQSTEKPIPPIDQAKELLREAMHRIRNQQAELDILRAKVDVMEKMHTMTTARSMDSYGHGLAAEAQADVAYRIERFIGGGK